MVVAVRNNSIVLGAASKALNDFVFFCKHCFYIRDKQGKIGPFVLNSSQRKIWELIKEQMDARRPVRVVVLKPRQIGISTFAAAFLLWEMLRRPVFAVTMAHKDEAARRVYGILQFAFEKLPLWLTTTIGVEALRNNSTGMELSHTRSQLDVYSAAGAEPGRAGTIQLVHLCMHKDSKVVLADGSSKSVKDVNVGDMVITSTGSIAPVKNVFYSGCKPTYRIRTWLSNEWVAVTAEHKVLTDSGWKQCKEITEDDYIQLPAVQLTSEVTDYEYFLPNKPTTRGARHKEYIKLPLDFDFGYLLGYYLAEGHIKSQYKRPSTFCKVTFAYCEGETYINRIAEYVTRVFRSCVKIKHRPGRRMEATIDDTFLAHLINNICGRTENKHVPEWFFRTTPEFIDGVIAGYFCGDGSKARTLVNGKYRENMVTVTSIHERIVRQIRRLLLARGYGVAALYYNAERYRYNKKTKPVYILGAYGDFGGKIRELMGLEGCSVGRNWVKKYKQHNGKWFVKIKSVEPYEVADVYDIEVDNPSHDFETPIGIVSNSETAFYPDADRVLASLFSAVPETPGTVVLEESTGAGATGYFPERYNRAKQGLDGYKVLFIPWYEHEEYRLPVPPGEKPVCPPSLRSLYEAGVIDDEQLWWRQTVLASKYAGREELFTREFPATEEEALFAEAANYFPPALVEKRLREIEGVPYEEGDVLPAAAGGGAVFVPRRGAELRVFRPPTPGRMYVIGADAASGVAGRGWANYSSADVLDVETGEQVAHLHLLGESGEFARRLRFLGEYYNQALIAVETTDGHGLAVAMWLRDAGYPSLYQRQVYDRVGQMWVSRLGWHTNARTKPFMLDILRSAFLAGKIVINDERTLREMLAFVRDENGKLGAAAGAQDDCVMSLSIAVMAWRDYGPHLAGSQRPPEPEEAVVPQAVNVRMRSREAEPLLHPELGAYL